MIFRTILLLLVVALHASSAQEGATRVIALRGRPQGSPRSIAIDSRLAADAALRVGDRVVIAAAPGEPGDTVVVAGVVQRRADPAEIARGEYRIRLHLGQLQALLGYGDRVDRFAVGTRSPAATTDAVARINATAFGFRAHRSADVAVETSKTFAVVSRFHRAIGVITIVASAIFLLCIMLLKVDERRRDVAALRLMGISAPTIVRSVVLEASAIAVLGSLVGVGVGLTASWIVNRHYQGVYRTPLRFSLVTGDIVLLAVALSLVLGIAAGWVAAMRLVRTPPLALFGR
ncbi:MAG TPA: FtsX-like permease family protein [Gemmatimonadaceae bacterium]|nr:FtsX-like permease family protein [Gemmatimonadaceae bacterium]